MRAMRGNTATQRGACVAWWNARQWSGGGAKGAWLKERLAEGTIDVLFVLEMVLDVTKVLQLNAWARGCGFAMRRMCESGAHGGVAILIRKATCR